MDFSLIVPALNEERKVTTDLKQIAATLCDASYSSEVIFVDDGSTDATRSRIEAFLREGEQRGNVLFRLVAHRPNRGKGYAIRQGVAASRGDIVAFMDSGLCVPLPYLEEGIRQVQRGADVAIASRRLPDSEIMRSAPIYRRLGSKVFWYFMRLFMGIKVTDTQCGFKFYKGSVARRLFAQVQTDGFMFDVEALMLAGRAGNRIVEFPVAWENDEDTRYDPIFGTIRNFKELIRIRMRLWMRGNVLVSES